MRKRLFLLALSLSVVMLVGAVAWGAPIRVGFVVPSTRDDLAWSQAMYEGIVAVQEELGSDKLELC